MQDLIIISVPIGTLSPQHAKDALNESWAHFKDRWPNTKVLVIPSKNDEHPEYQPIYDKTGIEIGGLLNIPVGSKSSSKAKEALGEYQKLVDERCPGAGIVVVPMKNGQAFRVLN